MCVSPCSLGLNSKPTARSHKMRTNFLYSIGKSAVPMEWNRQFAFVSPNSKIHSKENSRWTSQSWGQQAKLFCLNPLLWSLRDWATDSSIQNHFIGTTIAEAVPKGNSTTGAFFKRCNTSEHGFGVEKSATVFLFVLNYSEKIRTSVVFNLGVLNPTI